MLGLGLLSSAPGPQTLWLGISLFQLAPETERGAWKNFPHAPIWAPAWLPWLQSLLHLGPVPFCAWNLPVPISLGTKPQLLPVTYGALGDQPVTPLWTQPLPVWWPSPVQGKAAKPGDVDIFCEQEERQKEEGNQKERGGTLGGALTQRMLGEQCSGTSSVEQRRPSTRSPPAGPESLCRGRRWR